MPVYLITLHAYRSWTEDNPKGYVQRGVSGIKRPDEVRREQRASLANHPPRMFERKHQQAIVDLAQEITARRSIRLHAISCTNSHVHLIASWTGKEDLFHEIDSNHDQARRLANKVKTVLATLLSKQEGTIGNRWFSRGCDCIAVEDREHLNHLIEAYLPKHCTEGGVVTVYDKGETTP